MRNRLIVAFACTLLMAPGLARAQSEDDKSTARALANEGADAFEKGDFKTAADRFHRAVAIFDDAKAPTVPPTLLLGVARSDAKLGRYVSSTETYNRIIRQGTTAGAAPVFVAAVGDARREIEPLLPKIASVTIKVTGCDHPKVTVDDVAISAAALGVKKPVDPGSHVVKATAEGCEPGQTSFSVDEAKSTEATLALVKSPTPPPQAVADTHPGAGGAGEQGGSSLRTFSYVALGVGAAGVAVGAALYFLSPRSSSTKSAWIQPTIGPGSIGAVGRF